MGLFSEWRDLLPLGGAKVPGDRRSRHGARVEPTLDVRQQNTLREYGTIEEALAAARAGVVSDSGVAVTPTAFQRLAAVAACLRVKSDDLKSLPLIVYRRDSRRRVPADDLRVYSLLKDRPNEWQTSAEFRQLQERWRLTAGFAAALKVTNARGEPDELLPMDPARTEIRQDDRTLAVSFRYTRRDGRRVEMSRNEVFYVPYATLDGVRPLTPVEQFRETVGDGVAMRKHGSAFFANGAQPGVVLQSDQQIDADSKRAMREDWDERFGGDRKFGTAVLDRGVKAAAISISMEDAQWIEARKLNRTEIAGLYGVPLHRIGDLDRATFSNIEHQSLEYVIYGLTPDLVTWEQAIQRDLLGGYTQDLYAKFKVDALLRGDMKSRAETLQIKRRNGVLSANEWRELDDMNPRPDPAGDEYIVEQNMRPDDGRDPVAADSAPQEPGAQGQETET